MNLLCTQVFYNHYSCYIDTVFEFLWVHARLTDS